MDEPAPSQLALHINWHGTASQDSLTAWQFASSSLWALRCWIDLYVIKARRLRRRNGLRAALARRPRPSREAGTNRRDCQALRRRSPI